MNSTKVQNPRRYGGAPGKEPFKRASVSAIMGVEIWGKLLSVWGEGG